MGIRIGAHILAIGECGDFYFDPMDPEIESVKSDFPVLNPEAGAAMRELIAQAKAAGDSIGGIIECAVTGLPAGIGEPMFDGMENRIARIVFAIPAVKGIEFGAGFEAAGLFGSENNDDFFMDSENIRTASNNAGGILGGITSGMPVIFRAAVKPTPSIAQKQMSISLSRKENTALEIHGRHDPCIVPRAVPCMEAALAIAITDAMIESKMI
jgi:chorismate synthase